MVGLVERERELARLDAGLADVLAGDGRAVFVAGEAGTGKTSLVSAIVEDAVVESPDLVVAVGTCDPQPGVADPYLPFREILQELTGTLESERLAQAGGSENRKRLGRVASVAGDVLLEFGPDLIGLLVPGASLLAKIGTKTAQKAGLVEAVSKKVSGDGGSGGSSGLDQNLIFEQYVNVIRGIAEQRPLILVVDDLQWADTASIQLLFRLGRRLDGVKLMLVGTYRPNDVAAGRNDNRHPLEPVVGELQRYLGDIVVGLDQSDPELQRGFVDALLDAEPNTFDEEFRDTFWERTSGHPLFSVELLKGLKQTGGITVDSDYRWSTTADLDWRSVPGRVEGLIGERVRRLPPDLQELLRTASVEGDTFTVEVLSDIENTDRRDLIRRLSNELQRTHLLIEAEGVEWVEDQSLSRYRFVNKQIHEQVYADLDPVELSLYHSDTAAAFERLYGDRTDEVATRLAYHYIRAGNRKMAGRYLLDAAQKAWESYANDEALALVNRGLELTDFEDKQRRFDFLKVQVDVQARAGELDVGTLEFMETLAGDLNDDALRLDVFYQYQVFYTIHSDWDRVIEYGERAVKLAGDSPEHLTAKSKALHGIGLGHVRLSALDEAENYSRQALELAQELDDERLEMRILGNIAMVEFGRKNLAESRRIREEALPVAIRLGDKLSEATIHQNLGILGLPPGDYEYCRHHLQEAFRLTREVGDRQGEAASLSGLGEALYLAGEYDLSLEAAEEALEIAKGIEARWWIAFQKRSVADTLIALDRADEAVPLMEDAVRIYRELGSTPHLMDCIAGQARAQTATGDHATAMKTAEEAIQYILDDNDFTGAAYPYRIHWRKITIRSGQDS